MLRRPFVVRCRPSVHHFKSSSSPKPLGQSKKPNFMWSFHGSGERKFVRGIWVTWPTWPPRPYMVKSLQKFSSPEPMANGFGSWYVVKPHQSLFKWWPWVDLDLFYGKVKFGPLCFYMEKKKKKKTVRKSFNGRNLQQMTRVTWSICLNKNSDPRRLSAPAPGLYTCIKTSNSVYKISLTRNVFETGQSDKAFLLTSKFCPQWVVYPLPRGYIHVEKI